MVTTCPKCSAEYRYDDTSTMRELLLRRRGCCSACGEAIPEIRDLAERVLQFKATGSEKKVLSVFKMLGLDEWIDLQAIMELPEDEPPTPPSDTPPGPPLAVT